MLTSSASPSALAPARLRGCCTALESRLEPAEAESLAEILRALADPTRLQMLSMLRAAPQPVCVCDFTAAFELGQPTISHHLARLRDAGLVTSTRAGIWSFHALRSDLAPAARAALDLVP